MPLGTVWHQSILRKMSMIPESEGIKSTNHKTWKILAGSGK